MRGIDFLPGKKYFEPPSFSPSSTMFSKNFPFLDRQNSGLFGTQTYARGIDFLLSKKKKATTLICRYGVYGQRLVFNTIKRSRKYKRIKKTVFRTIELRRQ